MDQKISSRGGVVGGAVIIGCGLLMLPLGVGLAISYPHELWWLGVVLLGCSAMTLYGGIATMKKSSVRLKNTDEQILTIQKQIHSKNSKRHFYLVPASDTTVSEKDETILVHWIYQEDEWKNFYRWEMKDRRLNNAIIGILIAVIGTFFIRYLRDAGWAEAMIISGVVAIAYSFIGYKLAMSSLGASSHSKYNQVIVTPAAILINNKLNSFKDEDRWLKEVKILEDADPKVLEISYAWQTRKGHSTDSLHIPIPKGKLGEAVMLMDRLNGN